MCHDRGCEVVAGWLIRPQSSCRVGVLSSAVLVEQLLLCMHGWRAGHTVWGRLCPTTSLITPYLSIPLSNNASHPLLPCSTAPPPPCRSQSGMLPFKSNSPLTNEQWLMQAPFIIIVSACGGLLGAAFNVLRKKLWPIRASRRRTVLRLAEAAGVALATVGLTAGLALYFGR